MTHVADEPNSCAVAPVPAELLHDVFGRTQPTVEAIETAVAQGRVYGFRSWQGMYVVGYRDGEPEEIFFVGYSGD